MVLSCADGVFGAGELCAVIVRSDEERHLLARVLAGQHTVDCGDVLRASMPAPLIGSNWGFNPADRVVSELWLRAAAHGLDAKSYVSAVSSLLDDSAVLHGPYGKLSAMDRALIVYGSAYLVPSDIYVAEGRLLPEDPSIRARLEPLLEDIRHRAAVIFLASRMADCEEFLPERTAILSAGKLVFSSCPRGSFMQGWRN